MTFISRTYWPSLLLLWFIWAWDIDLLFLYCYCLIKGVSQTTKLEPVYLFFATKFSSQWRRQEEWIQNPVPFQSLIQHLGVGWSPSSLYPAGAAVFSKVGDVVRCEDGVFCCLCVVGFGGVSSRTSQLLRRRQGCGQGHTHASEALARCQLLRLQLNIVRA